MAHENLPRVSMAVPGAKARWDAIYNGDTITAKQSILDYEKRYGVTLSRQERREFFQGWRIGKITYITENILGLCQVIRAEQIESLADDLETVFQKHVQQRKLYI